MITQQNNGSEVSAYINAELANADSEVTIGNESGSSVATKLNGVFDDTFITSSQSGSQFAQAVEDGFEAMGGGDTPTPEPTDDHLKMRFLHISDLHGGTNSLEQCRDMVEEDSDIEAVIVSGDFCPYNATTNSAAYYNGDTLALLLGKNQTKGTTYPANEPIITNIDGEGTNKLLYVLGNHDRTDPSYAEIHLLDENDEEISTGIYSGGSQLAYAHNWLRYLLGDSVTYGGEGKAYWYKDITNTFDVDGETVTKVVRIIGIDDYENSNSTVKLVCYSQAQVTWLLNLLASTPSSYHILIITHESPFKESYPTHTAAESMQPQNATEANGIKLFVSELQSSFHERSGETNVNLLPMIMYAYMHNQNLNTTYTNNASFGVLDLVKDFSSITPARFLGYIFGHNHRDIVGYCPHQYYGDQLLLGITAADVSDNGNSTKYSGGDDLLWQISNDSGKQYATDEPHYRINELIIDFTAETLTIKRHGNKTTAAYSDTGVARPYGGRVRDEITFNLVENKS